MNLFRKKEILIVRLKQYRNLKEKVKKNHNLEIQEINRKIKELEKSIDNFNKKK